MRINSRIPNFRNLGIHLRVLLMHLVLLFLFVILQWQPGASGLNFWSDLTALSLDLLPPMLLALALLYVSYPRLSRLNYRKGMLLIVCIAVASTIGVTVIYQQFIAAVDEHNWLQVILICLADISLTLYYLNLIQRAYSPAIAEARLQALQARIRPHFLFNSLNAVLSLIRSQPKQAETALEDMAELFRVLMADNRSLVPLDQEIQLCKQYLSIESLRLGERLQCEWQLDALPQGLLIPPLILQPLVENAVYHGIESMPQGGQITVTMQMSGRSLMVRIQNPIPVSVVRSHGNKMAMKNIRERLRLHYDLEARFRQQTKDLQFIVELTIPTRPMSEVLHG